MKIYKILDQISRSSGYGFSPLEYLQIDVGKTDLPNMKWKITSSQSLITLKIVPGLLKKEDFYDDLVAALKKAYDTAVPLFVHSNLQKSIEIANLKAEIKRQNDLISTLNEQRTAVAPADKIHDPDQIRILEKELFGESIKATPVAAEEAQKKKSFLESEVQRLKGYSEMLRIRGDNYFKDKEAAEKELESFRELADSSQKKDETIAELKSEIGKLITEKTHVECKLRDQNQLIDKILQEYLPEQTRNVMLEMVRWSLCGYDWALGPSDSLREIMIKK